MRDFADGHFDRAAQLAHQAFDVELDVVEHLADRVALDHGFQDHFAFVVHADVTALVSPNRLCMSPRISW